MSEERCLIYLAGKVPKGDEIGAIEDWRRRYADALAEIESVAIASPEDPDLDESVPIEVFGHDCHLVAEADLIVVNAHTKLGVGTAQEMLIAKYLSRPVVTVLPRDTHHRRSNLEMHGRIVSDWIHPFIFCTSDAIVESLDELVLLLRSERWKEIRGGPKTLAVIDEAIDAYRRSPHAANSGMRRA